MSPLDLLRLVALAAGMVGAYPFFVFIGACGQLYSRAGVWMVRPSPSQIIRQEKIDIELHGRQNA